MSTEPRGILMEAVFDHLGYGPQFQILRNQPEFPEDAKAYALSHMRETGLGLAVLFIREDGQHEAWTRGQLEAWAKPAPKEATPLTDAVWRATESKDWKESFAVMHEHAEELERTLGVFKPLLAEVEGETTKDRMHTLVDQIYTAYCDYKSRQHNKDRFRNLVTAFLAAEFRSLRAELAESKKTAQCWFDRLIEMGCVLGKDNRWHNDRAEKLHAALVYVDRQVREVWKAEDTYQKTHREWSIEQAAKVLGPV